MLIKENERCDEKQTEGSGGIPNEFAERTQTVRSSQASYQVIFVAAVRRRQFSRSISFAILRHRNGFRKADHVPNRYISVSRMNSELERPNSLPYSISFVSSLFPRY